MNAYAFATNLRLRRIELGMSQEELGRMVGVARNTISEYENSVRYPTIDRVYDLANALQIPIADLLNPRAI